MTESNSRWYRTLSRRRVLQTVGAGTVVALAGCVGGDDDTDEPETEDPAGETDGEAADAYAFAEDGVFELDTESGEATELADTLGAGWEDIISTSSYIFAVENASSQVHVLDPAAGEVIQRIDVGSNPVHGAYLEDSDEVWVHSDDEAQFYIIDSESPAGVEETVAVGDANTGHGKLAATGDGRLLVTNMEKGGLFVVDTEGKETIDHIQLDDDDHDHDDNHDHDHDDTDYSYSTGSAVEFLHDDGGGTHYVAYNETSGLAFVEEMSEDDHHHHSGTGESELQYLSGDGAETSQLHDDDDARTVIVDVETGEVTGSFDASGGLFGLAAHDTVAIIDGDDLHFVDATDDHGHEQETITLDGASPGSIHYSETTAYTPNPQSGDISVLDLDSDEEIDRLDISGEDLGDLPAGSDGEQFVTVGEDTVTVVDMTEQELTEFDIPGVQIVGLPTAGAVSQ